MAETKNKCQVVEYYHKSGDIIFSVGKAPIVKKELAKNYKVFPSIKVRCKKEGDLVTGGFWKNCTVCKEHRKNIRKVSRFLNTIYTR